jgi:LmbE family N-acetylglucosaminyl deacetylase
MARVSLTVGKSYWFGAGGHGDAAICSRGAASLWPERSQRTPMLTLGFGTASATGLSALFLGAHADDIEIGCGGTILRLAREGVITSARWVVLSATGDRAIEAATGAAQLLHEIPDHEVTVEAFRDGFLPYSGDAIKEFFESLKQGSSPDLVFTPRRDDVHQDHRLVGELSWNSFRDQVILEYEIPKYEGDLGTPNLYVRLPEWAAHRKAELLVATYRTQADRAWFSEETFLSLMRLRAIECRASSGFAEAFVCRKVVL